MSLNNWWNNSASQANDFLGTGKFNDVVVSGFKPVGETQEFERLNRCTGSPQCPAGYACVNGFCTQMNASNPTDPSGGGASSSPGACDESSPNSPCNSGGPDACQQIPNCGKQDEARDCCGTRCCRFTGDGVRCFCGECPDQSTCSSFCESYSKANGELGPGCTGGDSGNSCSECSYCQNGECQPDESSFAPCWCGDGNACAAQDCSICDTVPESDTFGECVVRAEGCQQCATITNHRCSCNLTLPSVTACKVYGSSGPTAVNLAQQEAARQCTELCAVNPDPCEQTCQTATRCTDLGSGVAGCLEGETQTGAVLVGAQRCVFCEKCDTSNLPDFCSECDCNCDDDCPPCEVCNASGECERDPRCTPDGLFSLWIKPVYSSAPTQNCNQVCGASNNPTSEWVQHRNGLRLSQLGDFEYREIDLSDEEPSSFNCFSCSGKQTIGKIFYNGSETTQAPLVYVDYCFYNSANCGLPLSKLVGTLQIKFLPEGESPT